jgi:hypothetical protein
VCQYNSQKCAKRQHHGRDKKSLQNKNLKRHTPNAPHHPSSHLINKILLQKIYLQQEGIWHEKSTALRNRRVGAFYCPAVTRAGANQLNANSYGV